MTRKEWQRFLDDLETVVHVAAADWDHSAASRVESLIPRLRKAQVIEYVSEDENGEEKNQSV